MRVSRKMINDLVDCCRLENKDVVMFWRGTGLKSDVIINGVWYENLTNKQIYDLIWEKAMGY